MRFVFLMSLFSLSFSLSAQIVLTYENTAPAVGDTFYIANDYEKNTAIRNIKNAQGEFDWKQRSLKEFGYLYYTDSIDSGITISEKYQYMSLWWTETGYPHLTTEYRCNQNSLQAFFKRVYPFNYRTEPYTILKFPFKLGDSISQNIYVKKYVPRSDSAILTEVNVRTIALNEAILASKFRNRVRVLQVLTIKSQKLYHNGILRETIMDSTNRFYDGITRHPIAEHRNTTRYDRFGKLVYVFMSSDLVYREGIMNSVQELKDGTYELSIFPNPTSDRLNIKSKRAFSQIQLTSLSGQVLKEENFEQRVKHQVDISTLPKGIYVVTVSGPQGSGDQYLVVE